MKASYFFKVYFIDYAIIVVPFPPLYSPSPCTPPPTCIPPTLSSCPWVVHVSSLASPFHILFFKRFSLFIFRGEGREKEREKNINVWLPLAHPLLGTWPATQTCALSGNRTGDLLVHRPALNPLSHTSQGPQSILNFPLSVLYLPIMLLSPCTFPPILPSLPPH